MAKILIMASVEQRVRQEGRISCLLPARICTNIIYQRKVLQSCFNFAKRNIFSCLEFYEIFFTICGGKKELNINYTLITAHKTLLTVILEASERWVETLMVRWLTLVDEPEIFPIRFPDTAFYQSVPHLNKRHMSMLGIFCLENSISYPTALAWQTVFG